MREIWAHLSFPSPKQSEVHCDETSWTYIRAEIPLLGI